MQELITATECVKLYEAFLSAKKMRRVDEHICHTLERLGTDQCAEAVGLVMKRLDGKDTLGMYMRIHGMNAHAKQVFELFNEIRAFWLNMLINEHSSHDMYLLARYRDYLINLRDRGFTTSCSTIVSGFAQWCVNKFDADYYDWLIKGRKSKKLWQRIRNQECCPKLQEFIRQEILEVTNILIQEPK